MRIPTTVGRLGGAGLERVLPLADSGQCCLLCLASRKGAEQGVARRGWATSRVMLLEGRGRLGTDLFDDKSAGALWAVDRLPGDVLPPSFPWSAHRGQVDPELREVLGALAVHGHGGPERVWGRRRCAAKALCSEWGWLREHAPDPPDAGGGPEGGSLPAVGTESDLEEALKAVCAAPRSEALPERLALTCARHGRRALAAVLGSGTLTAPAAWLAEHHPEVARERVLIDVVGDVQRVLGAERVPFRHVRGGSLPSIGPPVSPGRAGWSRPWSVLRRRPRAVRGETSLTLPISVRRVVRGEFGFRVVSEVLLPKAEHSRTLTGPSVAAGRGGASAGQGTEQGVPGQLATIRWEGFSRAEDDLGNRYLILCRVEKGRPGLCRFLGSEMLTQTLFPALVPDARRLFLTNPGHVITHASTVDGQIRGRPRTHMVADGSVVTVEVR